MEGQWTRTQGERILSSRRSSILQKYSKIFVSNSKIPPNTLDYVSKITRQNGVGLQEGHSLATKALAVDGLGERQIIYFRDMATSMSPVF